MRCDAMRCDASMQILRAWRRAGLIHGDIKPQNIVVQLPHGDFSDSVSSAVYFRGIKVFLIDVEGIVRLPGPRTPTVAAGAGARFCKIVC
jgi:hypothetical protein